MEAINGMKDRNLHSLIEASIDAFVMLNTQNQIIDLNAAAVELFGMKRDNLKAANFFNFFREPRKVEEFTKEVYAKEWVTHATCEITNSKGEKIEVLFKGALNKLVDGTASGVVVVLRKMNKQNLLEQSLREYKMFFNQSADFMCIANTNAFFEAVNPVFMDVLGYAERELLDNPFLYFIHPDDIYNTKKEVISLRRGKRTEKFQNRYRKADGEFIWLEWNAHPTQGKVYAIARDITIQKKIEQDLQRSLKEISDYKYALDASSIVEVTDSKGVIKYVNENSCLISKYTAAELIGHDHRRLNSGYHSKEFIKNLLSTIASGKIWRDEMRNKAKDGSIYWVLTTIVPFVDEHGKPYQFVAIRTDITEKKRAEAELIESKMKAEEAMKSKQQFLANMSHEIRTPLNAIIGFTKVILKTELTAKQKEYVSAIKLSGDSLIVLINDILDLAKVDAGKMTFEKIPFKLESSTTSLMHLFDSKIQEKNLILRKSYDQRIPEVLLGDSMRLNQVILNLLSNAVKFTSMGEIELAIKLLHEDSKQVSIEFLVKDTGIGIKEESISNIFENFQQASSGTSRLYGGTGLGLAIVKKILEAQGGRIYVNSQFGIGTTFTFVLTFEKVRPDFNWKSEEIDIDERDERIIKVLVVEDMPMNQLLMKTILDDYGFERDIAENGKVAIEMMHSKAYDIILMDLQMPVMNGFEATDYIRNTMKSRIPIIALTADVTTMDLAKCTAAGMNDYISKPIDERVLFSRILSLVKKSPYISQQEMNTREVEISQKCIDLTYLKQRTKSNRTLMMDMISIYLEQTPILIEAMNKAYEDRDWTTLHAAAHKMIPSFSIVGIDERYECKAKEIQELASTHQDSKELKPLIIAVQEVCEQACKELMEIYTKLKND
ncbi:MAG: PAS domain S-box protein [Chitinophagales bacterium]|nr:PAS domain S-box protein [Chitinophagales bacterium]